MSDFVRNNVMNLQDTARRTAYFAPTAITSDDSFSQPQPSGATVAALGVSSTFPVWMIFSPEHFGLVFDSAFFRTELWANAWAKFGQKDISASMTRCLWGFSFVIPSAFWRTVSALMLGMTRLPFHLDAAIVARHDDPLPLAEAGAFSRAKNIVGFLKCARLALYDFPAMTARNFYHSPAGGLLALSRTVRFILMWFAALLALLTSSLGAFIRQVLSVAFMRAVFSSTAGLIVEFFTALLALKNSHKETSCWMTDALAEGASLQQEAKKTISVVLHPVKDRCALSTGNYSTFGLI